MECLNRSETKLEDLTFPPTPLERSPGQKLRRLGVVFAVLGFCKFCYNYLRYINQLSTSKYCYRTSNVGKLATDLFLGDRSYQFNNCLDDELPLFPENMLPLPPPLESSSDSAIVVMSCLEVWLERLVTRSKIPLDGIIGIEIGFINGRYTE